MSDKKMTKPMLKKIALITWILTLSVVMVNATTLSDTISSFTGTLSVTPVDASTGLTIDQNYNGESLEIDSEATSANGLEIYIAGTGQGLFVRQESGSNGQGIHVDQNSDGIGIEIDNAGTNDGLLIDQDGNGVSLNIDSEATTASGIEIDMIDSHTGSGFKLQTSSSELVTLLRDRSSTLGTFYFYRNLGGGADTSGAVVNIHQDHASDDQTALRVRQDGTGNALTVLNLGSGNGLFIDQDTDEIALEIDHEGTTNNALYIASANDGSAASLASRYAATLASTQAGGLLHLDRDNAAPATPVAYLLEDNTGSLQNVITIKNDGGGDSISLDHNGNGNPLYIENAGNQASIRIKEHGAGIQMESPDGTIYCFTIANGGTTNVAAGACTK